MWFGDELTAYIDKLESEGYTKAYSEDEVVKAQKKYEYFLRTAKEMGLTHGYQRVV